MRTRYALRRAPTRDQGSESAFEELTVRLAVGSDLLRKTSHLMHVYYPRAGDSVAKFLREMLPDSIHLRSSGAPEDEPYRVLVEGRPSEEQLRGSESLRSVIIPFAGLPPETRTRMAEYPGLALHNLHHNAIPTAELAITLVMAVAKGIVAEDRRLRRADWSPRYEGSGGLQLAGARALVIGYGEIGRRVASGLRGLGLKVSATRRRIDSAAEEDGVSVYPAAALSDQLPVHEVVVITAPLTAETEGMIGAEELALCPAQTVLVNVGRARLIDEAALYQALESRSIHGAGLDVWYRYPETKESRTNCLPSVWPFHRLDNVVMTPHRAGHVTDTDRARAQHLANALVQFEETGELPHRVDLNLGY